MTSHVLAGGLYLVAVIATAVAFPLCNTLFYKMRARGFPRVAAKQVSIIAVGLILLNGTLRVFERAKIGLPQIPIPDTLDWIPLLRENAFLIVANMVVLTGAFVFFEYHVLTTRTSVVDFLKRIFYRKDLADDINRFNVRLLTFFGPLLLAMHLEHHVNLNFEHFVDRHIQQICDATQRLPLKCKQESLSPSLSQFSNTSASALIGRTIIRQTD